MRTARRGFTLIELLIVITIIGLLLVFLTISIQGQVRRSNDARRKSDLFALHNYFEDYFNDKEAYPPEGSIDACGEAFYTYLPHIPCDPKTKAPYGYFPDTGTSGYRLCAVLEDATDPAIKAEGCDGPDGCGVGGGFNYCLSAGTTAVNVSGVGGYININPTPTPTPAGVPVTPGAGGYACAPVDSYGVSYCNWYSDPSGSGCPRTYPDGSCNGDCPWIASVRCTR